LKHGEQGEGQRLLLTGVDELLDMVRRRSAPGILVFDISGKLCHVNTKAKELIPSLEKAAIGGALAENAIPGALLELCERVKSSSGGEGQLEAAVFLSPSGSKSCAARAFLVGNPADERRATHVLVVLERVVEKHEADWGRVRERYTLTPREVEVVRLVWEGLSNREIGAHLYISEHTVKDHLKNVLRKMGVVSRAEMIALIR
jgi:DNA-binding NarL/FixJ family response regulator